jgi:DNA-binding NarL/FixJ family response regulator
MPLRVVLADDAALIRQALADLLGQAGIEVLAQAGNAPLLLRAVELPGRTRRADPLDALTSREREVLALMAAGQSNAGIVSIHG